jgi:hypothetical protein
MKLSWGLTLSSLSCAASAAREAHVYFYDAISGTATQAPSSVSPETARLILAKRLGLSQFHSIDSPSKDTIKQLNAFGGRQPKLFAGKSDRSSKHHDLIWFDDVEDINGMSRDEI